MAGSLVEIPYFFLSADGLVQGLQASREVALERPVPSWERFETLWFFFSLVPLALIGMVYWINPRWLTQSASVLQPQREESPFADQSGQQRIGIINAALILGLLISMGLLTSIYRQQYDLAFEASKLLLHIAGPALYLLIQIVLILIWGYLFYSAEVVVRQVRLLNFSLRYIAILLGLLQFFVLFAIPPEWRSTAAAVGLVGAGAMVVVAKILEFRQLAQQTSFSMHYHLLYLCSVEIAPLLIFIRIFFKI
jgi:hypothetical protein